MAFCTYFATRILLEHDVRRHRHVRGLVGRAVITPQSVRKIYPHHNCCYCLFVHLLADVPVRRRLATLGLVELEHFRVVAHQPAEVVVVVSVVDPAFTRHCQNICIPARDWSSKNDCLRTYGTDLSPSGVFSTWSTSYPVMAMTFPSNRSTRSCGSGMSGLRVHCKPTQPLSTPRDRRPRDPETAGKRRWTARASLRRPASTASGPRRRRRSTPATRSRTLLVSRHGGEKRLAGHAHPHPKQRPRGWPRGATRGWPRGAGHAHPQPHPPNRETEVSIG